MHEEQIKFLANIRDSGYEIIDYRNRVAFSHLESHTQN
jgi:hypothetical protein